MDVNGGKLDFTATLDNSQINAAIEETIKRVQGLSDGTASAGDEMGSAVDELQQKISSALNAIDKNIEFNQNEIKELKAQYQALGDEMNAALASGDTALATSKKEARRSIMQNISALARENNELEQSKKKVVENAKAWADNKAKQDENASSQDSLRARIKQVKDEMAALVIAASNEGRVLDENTGRYAELRDELGRLTDVQMDLQQQAKVLSNDEAQIAGVINGLSGLSGGFSAVTGAVSLFAGENENLQKVMTKLQSVMAITMGLQQLQQTLNKDSAFRLTTLANIRKWWGEVEAAANAKAAASTTAETAAKAANTAAQTANSSAKTTNTVATDANTKSEVANAGATALAGKAAATSAGFFRLLGTAIKSVPGIGWILAGVTALISALSVVTKKLREQKEAEEELEKAREEERKSINQAASDAIARIQELSYSYSKLGDDMKAKKQFIDDNKEAMQALGVAVNDVNDADNLLIKHKDDYIAAQMAMAKADAYRAKIKQLAEENADVLSNALAGMNEDDSDIASAPDADVINNGQIRAMQAKSNADIRKAKEDKEKVENEMRQWAEKAFGEESIYKALMSSFKKVSADATGEAKSAAEDSFSQQLASVKSRYEQFFAWVNSGDKDTRAAARTEFADLVEQGDTYLDYLKNQRAAIVDAIGSNEATQEQAAQMRVLNEQIAQETKETVLSQFEAQLQSELQGAQSLIEMLDIIKRKREEVNQNSTGNEDIDDEQQQILNDAEKDTQEKIDARTKQLLESYRGFGEQLVSIDKSYLEDVAFVEHQIAEATTEEEKARLNDMLDARRKAYDKERQEILDAETQTLVESSDAYLAFFNVAQGASKKMLRQILADAETVLKAVRGEAVELPTGISQELVEKIRQSPEEMKTLYNEVFELQEKLNEESGYPFASFVQGFKELKTSAELAAQAEKEVDDAARKATSDLSAVTRDRAMKSLASGATEALGKIGELGSKMQELGEAIDDSGLADLGATMAGLSSMLSDVAVGAMAGGGIGALIAGLVSVLTNVFDSYSEVERQQHRNALAASEFAHSVEMLNLQLKETFDNGFGERAFAKIADAARVAKDALAAYLDLYQSYTLYQNADGTLRAGEKPTSLSDINSSGWQLDWIKNARLKTYDANWWQEFWGTAEDEYTGITSLAPGILEEDGSINPDVAEEFLNSYGDMLDDSTKQAIQQAIDTKRAYLDALDALGEAAVETFGYLGDEARSSLVDAIVNGGDAWETWREKGSEAIEALGEQLMYELFLSSRFDSFKDTIAAIYKDNADDPERAANLAAEAMTKFIDDTQLSMDEAQRWGEEWRRQWKERGFDIWSDSSGATSFSGAVKTVSETTASVISGQMNAMRVNQVAANEMLRQQLLVLNSIKTDTLFLRSIDSRLRNIESAAANGSFVNRVNHI